MNASGAPPPEVWITGAGIVSALGSGLEAHGQALVRGRTGLERHSLFEGRPPDPCLCGRVPQEILPGPLEETASRRANLLLDRALEEVLSGAGLRAPVDADFFAGTTQGNMHGGSLYYARQRQGEDPDPSLITHFLPCAPVLAVAREHGIQGKKSTVSSACGSAAAALGRAFFRIRGGRAKRVIAGGFEALSPFVVAGFNTLRLVSPQHCRPFDPQRRGLNPGEGAALLLLESADSARERGARPLARLDGFGDALDAYHHTRAHPEGRGVARSMTRALDLAGVGPDAVDHLHLHGTATASNDISEYRACARVFGSRLPHIPVCSTKPMTGHTFGASAAVSAVLSMLSLQQCLVPATLFNEQLDPQMEDLRLCQEAEKTPDLRRVMTTSLGFGGESYALLLSRVNGHG